MNGEAKIRVLVIDDSKVSRLILTQIFEQAEDFELIGTASDGEAGLDAVERLNPDVITLDLAMPKVDGFQFLDNLKGNSDIPVIVVSSQSGADRVMEALERGATDFIAKIGAFHDGEPSVFFCESVLEKCRVAVGIWGNRASFEEVGRHLPLENSPYEQSSGETASRLLCIGASTGGPGALREILSDLNPEKGTAVLVAQHMPGGFTEALAERLNASTELTVREAVAGERLIGGVVYIAPGDYHLRLVKRRDNYWMELVMARRDDLCVPSVDELFSSVAECFDGPILGVVLTGMGNDGSKGAEALAKVGARIFVEAQETAVVFGMPKSVIDRGLADEVHGLSTLSLRVRAFLED